MMRGSVRGALGLVLSSALLTGCSDPESSDELELELGNGCDITRVDCQRAVFELTARVRGQTGTPMPAVRTITREDFAAELAEHAGGERDDAQSAWSSVLRLLELLPEGSTIEEEWNASAVESVAAYYDPATKEVSVIERGPSEPLDDLFVLSHEFVHALQDADVDLAAFQGAWVSTLDSSIAVRSLIEGEAMVLAVGVLLAALERAPQNFDWGGFGAQLHASLLENIGVAPAPLLTASQALPYPLGTKQLSPLWTAGGQRAIDELYAAPPLSTLDWATATKVTARTRVEPLDCLPTAGPPGFVAIGADSFGLVGVLAVRLAAAVSVDQAWSDALTLRGDRVIAFREEGVEDSYAVAWRLRFASSDAATRFAASRPAGQVALVSEREVVAYAMTRPEALPLWSDIAHCGTEGELPGSESMGQSDQALRRFGARLPLLR